MAALASIASTILIWRHSRGERWPPHDLFKGEEDGRLGGDGDRKIKRASGEHTRTPYPGSCSHSLPATRCRGGRPARSCPLGIPRFPSFLTAGPKLKSGCLRLHRIHDSDLASLTRVNAGHPTTFLREKRTAGSVATGTKNKNEPRGKHAYAVHLGLPLIPFQPTRCRGGRPARAVPLAFLASHRSRPQGPNLKVPALASIDPRLRFGVTTRVNCGHPTTFLSTCATDHPG